MKNFIQHLKESKFFDLIIGGHDVIMVFVSGSRIINCIDERSDYDLVVLTKNESRAESEYFFMYEGKKVHWYYECFPKSIDDLEKIQSVGLFNGLFLISQMSESMIIYINPKYNNCVHKIFRIQPILAKIGILKTTELMEKTINTILQERTVNKHAYTKYLYFLVVMKSYLNNEKYDCSYINAVKRIRWQTISEEYLQRLYEDIKVINQYYLDNCSDVKNLVESMIKTINNE